MANAIAKTILEQLGGNRFVAMTGAKQLVAGDNFLQFSIGRGAKNKANKVRITLEYGDVYKIEFYRIRNYFLDELGTVENLYADQLAAAFTEATGFDTKL